MSNLFDLFFDKFITITKSKDDRIHGKRLYADYREFFFRNFEKNQKVLSLPQFWKAMEAKNIYKQKCGSLVCYIGITSAYIS